MNTTFRLGYVPGVSPAKWARVWRERLPDVALDLVQVAVDSVAAELIAGTLDAALARLPAGHPGLSAIRLYDELPVVAFSRDHLLAASQDDDVIAPGDLAEETVYLPADDVLYAGDPPDGPPDGSTGGSTEGRRVTPPGRAPGAYLPDGTPDPGGQAPRPRDAAQALSWISSGAGVTILPMSLARLHHRKDVTHRVLADGPTAPVGLVWLTAAKTDLTEEMIGIVRGRTVNSSRGVARPAEPASGHAAARPGSGRAGSRRQPPSRSPQGRSDQRQANQRQANRGRGNRGRG